MSAPTQVAADHPPTRRALRTRWRWGVAQVCTSAVVSGSILGLLIVGGSEPGPLGRNVRNISVFLGLALLVAAALTLASVGSLVQAARISRTLHRYPWRRLSGRYKHEVLLYAFGHYIQPKGSPISALKAWSVDVPPMLLHVVPIGTTSRRALGAFKGDEVWLAIGETDRRGVGALPPGAPLFRVVRVRAGSRWEREYARLFDRPDDDT